MPDEPRSIRNVVRCTGHTKSGARCSRRTAKTSLCYQHLEMKEHVKIKPSHIAGAGLGLYTTIPRKKRQRITDYTGDHVVRPEGDDSFGGDYVLEIKKHPPTYIDARKTTEPGAGRWANSARRGNGVTNNSHLSINRNNGTAGVVMTRNLPGATKVNPREILTAYGNNYW